MKILCCLLFASSVSLAGTFEELDREQEYLGKNFQSLRSSLLSDADLKLAVEAGDRQQVNTTVDSIRDFFTAYDRFNLRKIDAFFEAVLLRARAEALRETQENGRLSRAARTELRKLEDFGRRYGELKVHFGTNRDVERLDVGHDLLQIYGNFANAIRRGRGDRPTRAYGPGKLVAFIDRPRDLIRVSGQLTKLLYSSYFQSNRGRPDSAPIPEALASTQRRLVALRNIQVSWEGLENIGNLEHDGKTLHMFLINHANSFLDTSAQQAFPVKGMSSIGNVDIFFPRFLAQRMVKSDHMITVGHGDTTQKTIDLVRSRQLNRFFLAAEGITGTGLYEMRPVMPLFSLAVYDAIERGLDVNLYPVAFPDNFRLLNDWRDPIEGEKLVRGVVMPPISTQLCLGLRELTGSPDAISLLLRWHWFRTLSHSNREVLSMPYPTEIQRRLEAMIWGTDGGPASTEASP